MYNSTSGKVRLIADDTLVSGHLPVPDGTLEDITICHNWIKNSGATGIGVVAGFAAAMPTEPIIGAVGLPATSAAFVVIDRVILENNRIESAVANEPELGAVSSAGPRASYGAGAVALSSGELAVVRDNRVDQVGVGHNFPVCGVYAHQADHVAVDGNRLTRIGTHISHRWIGYRSGAARRRLHQSRAPDLFV